MKPNEGVDAMSTSGHGARGGRPGPGGAAGDPAPSGEVAVIGAGVTIKGDVEAEIDLQIDGIVHGDVRCGTLIVNERGLVSGSIVAERVRVAGHVDGGIEATDLAVEAGAHIKGDISYSRLRVSNGGVFEGTMTHRPLAEEPTEAERLKLVNGGAGGGGVSTSSSDAPPKPQRVHYID
jgi:cytoskeletal protein CcmA (bactofilin family)